MSAIPSSKRDSAEFLENLNPSDENTADFSATGVAGHFYTGLFGYVITKLIIAVIMKDYFHIPDIYVYETIIFLMTIFS